MPPRISSKSLLDNVEDGDVVTTETVKRVGVELFNHIYAHDFTVSVGSRPDRPDGQFVSADIFEGSITKAFRIDVARVSKNINALLYYTKITRHTVAICNGEPDDDDTKEIVILVLHPEFDRNIFKELAAHDLRVSLSSRELLSAMDQRLDGLFSTSDRIETDIGVIRRILEEQVIPALCDR